MADQPKFNHLEARELNLGASLTDSDPSSQYHTVKYDFRPASVDEHKVATMDVATKNEVTITVPHLDGAGVPETICKDSHRPYTKECVLIIDHAIGEMTLEKLSSNIQLKKTRDKKSNLQPGPILPVLASTTSTTRRFSRTRVPRGNRSNRNPSIRCTKPQCVPESIIAPESAIDIAGPCNLMYSMPRLWISQPPTVTWHHPSPWTGGDDRDAPLLLLGSDIAQAPAFMPSSPQLEMTHQQASPLPPSPMNVLQALVDDNTSTLSTFSNSGDVSVGNDSDISSPYSELDDSG
ncbi:ell-associated factor Eaf-like [Hyposmocoma kahamanoa]|uniref:ell-associated factor Eaf-like n=1 Tax=Hyposmocoma kahamanoa TaxID=1477025 RepID=UPI000E6D7998|nr:ell-associated factor Eaf-like [Hyposmocoma kahamanoa]